MDKTENERDFIETVFATGRFLWTALGEVGRGVIDNRVPARLCYGGMALALALYFKLDMWAFPKLKFHLQPTLRHILVYTCLVSGWVIWGIYQAAVRGRMLNRLKDAFESAKLKCNGRYPSLVEDVKIDRHVRKLRLLCNGIPKSDFASGIERIESVLNMTVVKLLQDESDKSKIEILYTMKDLAKKIVLENPNAYPDGDIPIGESYEGPIVVNMRDIAHILVAGQTGGGKSNFLKLATTVLTVNNREADVIFLDFKGGMESADIRSHAKNLGSNIECFEGSAASVAKLGQLGMILETRFNVMAALGASTFDDYLKRSVALNAKGGQTIRAQDERRTYIIIDEIAQMYSHDPGVDKEKLKSAKAAVNRIARQGRAAGVHLIVATQKPDASSFDQTVKANLPAVLCFPMANQASSVSALGTKRAFEINPEIKGRAVWKFGPKIEEVQTYFFGEADFKKENLNGPRNTVES